MEIGALHTEATAEPVAEVAIPPAIRRELRFLRPDGRSMRDVPIPPAIPDDPVHALRVRNEVDGLRLDTSTTRPTWLGERLDVGWAIDVLHPRALQPSAIDE